MKVNDDGELVVVEETTAPALENQFDMVDVEGAAAFMDNYQEVVKALLAPSDYQKIGFKDFKKKSAWRKLATAFRISDDIVDEDIVRDETNQIVSAKYYVRATLPNGRSSMGVGVCSIFDKIRYKASDKNQADKETPSNFVLRGRFSNAEHDVPSTAHSRAKNRAIADLIGAGEVSAEEMEGEFSKKVSRTRTSPSNESKPKRKSRKTKTPKDVEVIEAKAEVVSEETTPKSSKSLKEISEENSAIKQAITLLKDDPTVTINKSAVIDELFIMFDLGKISLDEYDESKAILMDN